MAQKTEQQKQNFGAGPWMFKKGGINKYSLVTPENKVNAIVKGRILYIIETIGTHYMFRGTMIVDPCFHKGWFKIPFRPWMNGFPGHFRVYFPEDMNYNETLQTNRILINKYMEENNLYINREDPILTYFKEQSKQKNTWPIH